MKRIAAGVNLIVLAACAASGQTIPVSPGFEVVSIKPSDPAAGAMQVGVSPGGVFTAKNVTVKALIQQAYNVRDFQISGGSGWIDTERYDIAAKGNGPGVSEDELRKMTDSQREQFREQLTGRVRALLADRFELKVHQETKEMPVYALTIAKNGIRFRAAADEDVTHSGLSVRKGADGRVELTAARVPLESLIRILSDAVGRTVLDKTDLHGNYDFKLTFAPDMGPSAGTPSAADPGAPSIFTALLEQLGLRLESQKGPVEVLVIDSAQRASEN
jgi:uncharacterized protein (TIGR03435 family)